MATSTKIAPTLAAAARQLYASTAAAPLTGLVRSDSKGRIQVYVYVTNTSLNVISELGAHKLQDVVISPTMQIAEGWVKPQDLDSLAALPFVIRITPPRYARQRSLEPVL
ncbi:MAG: hypothetical protein WBR15_02495 [Gammaproteobacteria bacterium]